MTGLLGTIQSSEWVRRCLVAGAAACVALGLLTAYSSWSTDLGPGEIEIRASLVAEGSSVLDIPPLGAIRASTHSAPLEVSARLDRVDVQQVQQIAGTSDPVNDLSRSVERDLDGALSQFVIRTLILAMVVGTVAGLLVSRRRSTLLIAPVASLVAVGGLLGITWRGYDVEAFEQPQFTGTLTEAPAVLSTVRRHVAGIEDASKRIGELSGQIASVYQSAATDPGVSQNEVRILHVSDMHSNPIGFELARRLAESFSVQAVIDTGDVTSFGSPVESRVGDLLKDMPAPYYIVPGNHDSPGNRTSLGAVPGVTILDGSQVSVGDVQILGVGDPTFTADNKTSRGEATDTQLEAAPDVAALLASNNDVDVLAVHNRLLAQDSIGKVPLVIAGHTHRREVIERGGTLGLVVGSTGAGGLGALTGDEKTPYEAEVLHFESGKLTAVDYVRYNEAAEDFTITRSAVPLATTKSWIAE